MGYPYLYALSLLLALIASSFWLSASRALRQNDIHVLRLLVRRCDHPNGFWAAFLLCAAMSLLTGMVALAVFGFAFFPP
ncbi:hypothetical protein GCM10022276_14110 [Sphingomonas limnosediminicola]|uniref:Uncharacterized protein n=1 Tax=Sphingomonas limnosediminicola TaxID=940133 RepID=A0ABP7L9R5_9SPHN